MHRRDVPPVRHQTLRKSEGDIFPDRDQLWPSKRAFGPLLRTRVKSGRTNSLDRREARTTKHLANTTSRKPKAESCIVICQRLALKGEFLVHGDF